MTTTTGTFTEKFRAAAVRNDSLLCVGLDPDPTQIPEGLTTREFLFQLVDTTADLVCAYKPNIAFFEPDLGEGITLLRDLIAYIPDDVPVLLDAKRGDVGHTAEAYARAIYNSLGADAVTLSPYLGRDSLEPFLRRADRTAFLVCRTSNAGAGDLQDLSAGGRPIYEHVASLANEWNEHENVGLVVGATYPAEAKRIREISPDLPFLMPGVGAQAGDVEQAVQAAMDADGAGILVNASRGVMFAPVAEGERWTDASRRAAMALRDQINAARRR
ncbi:MAG: orotidine-5'-phosphate decarboxylase [Chloroflexi bacterium]|nr:orotidine-5'-phosphate decarboxylase [Chloroflexota bacterium]MQC16757.1 orotidine-5'-phosphate decarboxylase [Chloroflexota bacterium]MQC47882.1 orotidine-5'-phosphate decarboxylase [Chloroflexota bacterium]